MDKAQVLRKVIFGERTAEEETQLLASYFVETDNWHRVYDGDVDVVYGPKGSGKSAIYSVLGSNTPPLAASPMVSRAYDTPMLASGRVIPYWFRAPILSLTGEYSLYLLKIQEEHPHFKTLQPTLRLRNENSSVFGKSILYPCFTVLLLNTD